MFSLFSKSIDFFYFIKHATFCACLKKRIKDATFTFIVEWAILCNAEEIITEEIIK